MLRLKEAANALGQQYLPLCFDMGLLTKALEIVWAHPTELEGVILVEGGMHLLMSVIAGIGHLYGDAGLNNLLHESGVFAPRTVDHMLSGKDFDKVLYGLKLVEEALCAQFFVNFNKWCANMSHVTSPTLKILLDELESNSVDNTNIHDVVDQICILLKNEMIPLMGAFRRDGQASSPTFKLWDDILFKVLLPLKTFISATRDGLWTVQQSAKCDFLPLLFASNRTNYSRYMPTQIAAMTQLPSEMKEQFMSGRCSVKLSNGMFKGVWLDYALETTENKDLKGVGGIIGLTMRDSALIRWFLARPVTATYATALQTATEHEKSGINPIPHFQMPSAKKRWDLDVNKLRVMFTGPFIDPFDISEASQKLINIATGAIASDDVQESPCQTERLAPDSPKSFYDPLPRSNIKTMTDMRKKVKIRSKHISINGEVMYLRLLAVNSVKKVPLNQVMSFKNAPVPVSLFNEDGTMTQSTKSDFMHKLEETIAGNKMTRLESDVNAIIFDGHAVIQTLAPKYTALHVTYDNMAEGFMSHIINISKHISPNNYPDIHIAFDKYISGSIKSQTRERRSSGKSSQV